MSQNAIMSNNPDEKIMDETTTKIEPIEPIEQKVIFTGKGIEFFKIWIVNLLLSILTLGIYSAWAKVRTNQYFYGNTSIDGHAFRYLARPLQILKGRIIAVVVFAIVVALTTLSPSAAVFFWLVFFLVFPWLLIQSIKFNMRMTSFRNVRFDFNATYMNTFGIILLLPILIPLSVGLAFPWIKKTQDKFMHNNVSYGSQSVSVNTKTSTYFFALFMTTITLLIFGLFFTYLITSLTQILVPYLSDVMYRLMNAIGLSDLYWNMNIAVALMIFLA